MALDRIGYDLLGEEQLSTEKILSELLNNKNINLKTHVLTPVELAILEAYVEQIKEMTVCAKKRGWKKTSKFLDTFLLRFKEFMVSWNRLSRQEIVQTLAEIRKEKTARSLTERLLGAKE